MGMFDDLRCKYPLPVEGANNVAYQTKDAQADPYMEQFEIREDGSIWRELYDVEDRSDFALGIGEDKFAGCMSRINKRWEPHNITGEVRFYTWDKDAGSLEFSSYFLNGQLRELHLIECSDKMRAALRTIGETEER